jgi:hypothetical protein
MLIQDHRQVMILELESGVIDRRRRAGYSVCAGDKTFLIVATVVDI